jgi:hypothetical protein
VPKPHDDEGLPQPKLKVGGKPDGLADNRREAFGTLPFWVHALTTHSADCPGLTAVATLCRLTHRLARGALLAIKADSVADAVAVLSLLAEDAGTCDGEGETPPEGAGDGGAAEAAGPGDGVGGTVGCVVPEPALLGGGEDVGGADVGGADVGGGADEVGVGVGAGVV